MLLLFLKSQEKLVLICPKSSRDLSRARVMGSLCYMVPSSGPSFFTACLMAMSVDGSASPSNGSGFNYS